MFGHPPQAVVDAYGDGMQAGARHALARLAKEADKRPNGLSGDDIRLMLAEYVRLTSR